MLARDPVEAAEQARAFLKEKPLGAYYDEILLEGLRLAQADAERGLLDDERMRRIRDSVAEIVDDLPRRPGSPSMAWPATGTLVRYGDDSNECGAVKLQFDAGRRRSDRLGDTVAPLHALVAAAESDYM